MKHASQHFMWITWTLFSCWCVYLWIISWLLYECVHLSNCAESFWASRFGCCCLQRQIECYGEPLSVPPTRWRSRTSSFSPSSGSAGKLKMEPQLSLQWNHLFIFDFHTFANNYDNIKHVQPVNWIKSQAWPDLCSRVFMLTASPAGSFVLSKWILFQ